MVDDDVWKFKKYLLTLCYIMLTNRKSYTGILVRKKFQKFGFKNITKECTQYHTK